MLACLFFYLNDLHRVNTSRSIILTNGSFDFLFLYTYTFISEKKTYDRQVMKLGLNHTQTKMMRDSSITCSHLLLYNMFVYMWQSTPSYSLVVVSGGDIHHICSIVLVFFLNGNRRKMVYTSSDTWNIRQHRFFHRSIDYYFVIQNRYLIWEESWRMNQPYID
jgi:hypothetical protein